MPVLFRPEPGLLGSAANISFPGSAWERTPLPALPAGNEAEPCGQSVARQEPRTRFSWCVRHDAQRHDLTLDNRGAKVIRDSGRYVMHALHKFEKPKGQPTPSAIGHPLSGFGNDLFATIAPNTAPGTVPSAPTTDPST